MVIAQGRALSELRDEMAFHRGIDSGQSSIYSPHPNISISTGEFGGSLMRLDKLGIQIHAEDGTPGIFWVNKFNSELTAGEDTVGAVTPPFSYIIADTPNEGYTRLYLTSKGEDSTARIGLFGGGGGGTIFFGTQTGGTSTGPYISIEGGPLEIYATTSDPTSISDGMIWYRYNTDKMRLRADGATHNIATETWVTAGFTALGGWVPNVTAQSTTYAAVANDVVLCTGTFTVTLPSAAANAEKVIVIKNVSTGQITVDGASAETIDDETDIIIGTYESVTLICDGSEWWII